MKKYIAMLLMVVMTAGLTGCGEKETPMGDTAGSQETVEAPEEAEETGTAASWRPERAVNVIVNTGAGGQTDLTVRAMCQSLEEIMGVTFTVNNMTGGSGAIGANYVFDAPHDGYTLLGLSGGGCNALPVLGSFDHTSEDMNICAVLCSSAILSVPSGSPYETLEDLLGAGKSLNAGASQAGCCWQIMLSLFADSVGLDVNTLPYEGSAPTHVAALSGEIDFCVTGLSEQLDYIKSGDLRPLACLGRDAVEVEGFGSIPSAADVSPEFAEKCSEATDYISWCGLALPADCPQEVIDAYNDAFAQALESDAVKEINETLGTTIIGIYGEEAAKVMKTMDSLFAWTLYESGIATVSPEEFGIEKLD